MIRYIFITNSPELASFATARGVDRVMVDLELLGKVERQGHLSTVISRHSFEDVPRVRAVIPGKELIVRLNPVHEGTGKEVDRAISLGADILMLPMFRRADEVEHFCRLVGGRARVMLLLETAKAAENLKQILAVPGIDEIHIGLNDLHLDLGLNFMFEPLANGTVDGLAAIIGESGLPFGIGGLARAGEGLLPADLLVAEHVRLGSTGAILSRTFHRNSATVADIEKEMDFAFEVARLQDAYQAHRRASANELRALHEDVAARVASIVRSKTGGA